MVGLQAFLSGNASEPTFLHRPEVRARDHGRVFRRRRGLTEPAWNLLKEEARRTPNVECLEPVDLEQTYFCPEAFQLDVWHKRHRDEDRTTIVKYRKTNAEGDWDVVEFEELSGDEFCREPKPYATMTVRRHEIRSKEVSAHTRPSWRLVLDEATFREGDPHSTFTVEKLDLETTLPPSIAAVVDLDTFAPVRSKIMEFAYRYDRDRYREWSAPLRLCPFYEYSILDGQKEAAYRDRSDDERWRLRLRIEGLACLPEDLTSWSEECVSESEESEVENDEE